MKNENYETLIWSGCSHSFGSGMLNEDFNFEIQQHGSLENAPVKWCNEKMRNDFPTVKNFAQAIKAVKERAYPHQIGKKLGFENTYNLSVPGMGIETQLRNVSSFILQNENIIDFSKTVFCYQLPSFTRVEIIKTGTEIFEENCWSWHFFNFAMVDENDQFGKDFFTRHFDYDFYTAKFLMYLYEYKGFLDSKKIKFLPFIFGENIMEKFEFYFPYQRKEGVIVNKMNNSRNWLHHTQIFPNRKEILEKIGIWDIKFTVGKTLKSEGYCEDHHWSPRGHDEIAEHISNLLKEKLSL